MNAFDLQSVLRSASKLVLTGGMVGKVCKVLIIAAITMGAIAWSVRVLWVSVLALVLVFLLCFVMLWRVISFADKNPQAAILEGAEFLMHEQLMLGTKDNPNIRSIIQQQIEAFQVRLTSEEERQLLKPDPPVPQASDSMVEEKEESNG